MGTPPEGENAVPEDPSIAAKREDLTAQLNALLAPVQKAEASFLEADGLVRQIDQLLRDRQTDQQAFDDFSHAAEPGALAAGMGRPAAGNR